MFNLSPKLKKFVYTIMLIIFALQIVSPVLLYPKPAEAQFGGVVHDIITFIGEKAEWAWEKTEKYRDWLRKHGVTQSLNSAIQIFSQKLAYNIAVDIASGGPGGKPKFFKYVWNKYLKSASQDAGGEFIAGLSSGVKGDCSGCPEFGKAPRKCSSDADCKVRNERGDVVCEGECLGASKGFEGWIGLNLCEPKIPTVKFNMVLNLAGLVEPKLRKPRCDWNEIMANKDKFFAEAKFPEVLNKLQFSFDVQQSEVGTFMSLWDKMTGEQQEKKWLAATKRESFNEMKPSRETISEDIKSPVPGLIEEAKSLVPKIPDPIGTQILGGYITGNILSPFITTFTNTLAARLMKKWTKGFVTGKKTITGKTIYDWLYPEKREWGEVGSRIGAKAAREILSDLMVAPIMTSNEEMDVLTNFSVCPPGKYASEDNCVIDNDFAFAVREQMTIREALDKGYLHGDWLVAERYIRDSTIDYSRRYSLTNIKKLRKARIVPLGLEIAASMIYNGEEIKPGIIVKSKVSLREIVDGFKQNGEDGICGTGDEGESPFCHLVDPDWVLKAPLAQCVSKVYGPTPLPNVADRKEYCAKSEDCIKRDDKGTCLAWGHCTKEKNIYRLNGDECPSYYNTCTTYRRTSDGQVFSYLTSTLDFATCDASSVGCQWYSTCQDDEGNWEGDDEICGDPNKLDRIYLNRNVEECDSSDEGCHQFIKLEKGVNLIENGGFEENKEDKWPKGWQPYTPFSPGAGFGYDATGEKSYSGNSAIKPSINVSQSLPLNWYQLRLKQTLTVSAYVKGEGEREGVDLIEIKVPGHIIFETGEADNAEWSDNVLKANVTENYQRVSGTFSLLYSGAEIRSSSPVELKLKGNGNIWYDNVQLELGDEATEYKEYGTSGNVYLKKAPDYYHCYDSNPTNDSPYCSSFVLGCGINEIGCEKYTPENGDPWLPGIISEDDLCPEECLGYQTYKQVPMWWETPPEEGKNYVTDGMYDFIASTARTCSANQVGCQEYTNLDVVAAGGEGREYYTFGQICQKPENELCKTFYTWEGDDRIGYQLKPHRILEDDTDSHSPCISLKSDDLTDLENAECDLGSDPLRDYGSGRAGQSCEYGSDPNCLEFYDEDGNIFHADRRRIISCTDDCHPYRLTITDYTDNYDNASREWRDGGDGIPDLCPPNLVSNHLDDYYLHPNFQNQSNLQILKKYKENDCQYHLLKSGAVLIGNQSDRLGINNVTN